MNEEIKDKKINRTDSEVQYMDLLARARAIEEREVNKHHLAVQLPIWSNDKRGVPNSLLRSALFSGIQSKDRQFFKEEIIFSQQGILIQYTGQQLNQDDLMVWETLLHLVKNKSIGTEFKFRSEFLLKEMGLAVSKQSYETLNKAMIRLTQGSLTVSYKNRKYYGSLINAMLIDEKTTEYDVSLNPKLINLYDRNQWTAINWAAQKKFKRKALAQYLFTFYSTHKKPMPMKIETILHLSGSQSKKVSQFKRRLIVALDELVNEEFLNGYDIENGLVIVNRA